MDRLNIGPEEARVIRTALESLQDVESTSEDSLAAIRLATVRTFPERLVTALGDMKAGQTESGALLVQGLTDQTDLPPTPAEVAALSGDALTLVAEIVELGVALILGEPVGYCAEKNGALVQHVFPVRSEERSPSNESSSTMLDLHTELVFSRSHPTRHLDAASPDFVLLCCLRNDLNRAASTLVVRIQDLCARTPPADLAVLREPRFELRAPYSFTQDRPEDRPWVGPVPIIGPNEASATGAFDLACGARGIDDEAERALHAFRNAASSPGLIWPVRLQPGDILILDNRRCAHGRTPFHAAYDGRDRWILRAYVRRSLKGMVPSDGARSPRVF